MIKEITEKDIKKALELVNRVFTEFVANDYSEEGQNTFQNYLKIKDAEFSSDLKSGHKKAWGYYFGDEIIGVIAIRDGTHIALLFVDKSHHRKGIARALFNRVLKEVKKKGEDTKITVNASPYAVGIYEKLGFIKTAERQEKNGIIFFPMVYEDSLFNYLDKLHITEMGAKRVKRNLNLVTDDVAKWCKTYILEAEKTSILIILRKGKNWYVYTPEIEITVNAGSFTIITAHKLKTIVRTMTEADYPVLREFLYQAIFIPEGIEPPPREIIDNPEIIVYIKDFGTLKGDLGVVAERGGQIVGAAWTRIIPAFGHLDGDTPELAISVLPEYRNFGIGAKMMNALFRLLQENGYKKTSLSVQKDNPAVRFYLRLGYKVICERPDFAGHEDFLMIKDFN